MVLAEGTRVANRYEILSPLGSGGQAEAYRAKDLHEGDIVALKLLQSFPPGQLWLEAQALRQLSDPHVLPIRNADVDAGQPFLVTELATHGTLDDLLSASGSCGLRVDEVVRFLRQAANGVGRAHAIRLIHNDIKPKNLFLNSEGECLVGDFGGACLLPQGAETGTPHVTTPPITAPEIARIWDAASIRSDVYSLGATAFWLIAGRPAHNFPPGASVQEALAIVANEVPQRLWDYAPHVPTNVATTIDTAMARDPANRFETAAEFAAALGRRPAVPRRWRRTDEHSEHLACWRGESPTGGTYITCLEEGARASKAVITSKHLSSGRRITKGCKTVNSRDVAQRLRGVFRALS
jgi:eukaryotic-like serine/threonine-protein kinase